MKRNLSTAWFKSIPDIDMSGKLKTIELLLSQEDYATILRVLDENLGEMIEEPSRVQSVVQNTKKTVSEDSQKSTGEFMSRRFPFY